MTNRLFLIAALLAAYSTIALAKFNVAAKTYVGKAPALSTDAESEIADLSTV